MRERILPCSELAVSVRPPSRAFAAGEDVAFFYALLACNVVLDPMVARSHNAPVTFNYVQLSRPIWQDLGMAVECRAEILDVDAIRGCRIDVNVFLITRFGISQYF